MVEGPGPTCRLLKHWSEIFTFLIGLLYSLLSWKCVANRFWIWINKCQDHSLFWLTVHLCIAHHTCFVGIYTKIKKVIVLILSHSCLIFAIGVIMFIYKGPSKNIVSLHQKNAKLSWSTHHSAGLVCECVGDSRWYECSCVIDMCKCPTNVHELRE